MKLKLFYWTILLFFGLILLPSTVEAATYYISPSGNDTSGNGSTGSPWKTFSKGISVLGTGDTLRAYGGTYNEQVMIPRTLNGTEANRITIEAVEGQTPIISFSTNSGQVVRIYGSYITFKDIEVYGQNASSSLTQCIVLRPHTSNATNLTNVILTNLTVHGCGGHGIDVGGSYTGSATLNATNIVLSNSKIYNSSLTNTNGAVGSSGWASGVKISRDAENITINGNQIYNNWGEGIAITRGNEVNFYANTVYNNFGVNIYVDNSKNIDIHKNFSYCLNTGDGNLILKSGNKAIGIAAGEEHYSDSPLWGNQLSNIQVYNNLVYNCQRSFDFFGTDSGSGGLRDSIIANNTFYSTDTTVSPIYFYQESQTDVEFYNNIVRANPSQNKFVYFDGTTAGSHTFHHNYWVYESGSPSSIVTGPGDITGNLASVDFLSAVSFDKESFKIDEQSLAVDAGTTIPINITTDLAGEVRYADPDIGAYEYGEPLWTTWEQNGGKTSAAVAAKTFNGRLYQAIRGNSYPFYIYIRSSADGQDWSVWDKNSVDGKMSTEASLVTYTPSEGQYAGQERLFISVRGNSQEIFTKSMGSDEVWETQWNQNGGKSGAGIAMTVFDGKLYQIIRGQSVEGQLWMRYTIDGTFDYDAINNPEDVSEQWLPIVGKTQHTPSIATFDGKLVLSVRGNSGQIFNAFSTDGLFDLSTAGENFVQNGGATSASPSLVVNNGKLYQSVKGNSTDQIWNRYTTDITNNSAWTTWEEEGGSTSTKVAIEGFGTFLYQFIRGTSGEIYSRRSESY